MTGLEIKTLAELHTEDLVIEDSQAVVFINECILMDLGKDAGVIASHTLDVERDTWVDLPRSFLSVFEIEKEGTPTPYYGRKYKAFYDGSFDIRDNKIRFQESGTFTLWGYVMPRAFTNLYREPGVHEVLHYPIAIYVASRAIFWDDEENPTAQMKMNEYFMHKQKALEQLAEIQPTTSRIRMVRMRPFA